MEEWKGGGKEIWVRWVEESRREWSRGSQRRSEGGSVGRR